MPFKTLVTILFVTFFVVFVVSIITLNQETVDVRFALLEPISMELWMLMLAAFGTGASLILFFDIAGGARRYARDWRAKRAHRAQEEAEDLFLRGLDSMINGRYEKALARFDEVLDREPGHVNALIKKGDSLRLLKRFREAAESLERATRLEPANLAALYSLSDVFIEIGADERAKITLEGIIEIDPETTVSAHRKMRDLYLRQARWEEADRIQKKLLEMVSGAAEREYENETAKGILLGLGEHKLEQGELSAALEAFRNIIQQDDQFIAAYVRLGEVHAALEEEEQAIEVWRRGYEATGSTEPLTSLQNYYLRLEQPEEAISVWKQALLLAEQEVPLRYCLGKLYYRLFMLDEALREFQLIEDRVSGLPALHLLIARILESKGELKGALAKTKLLMAEVEGLMMDIVCKHCQWRQSDWKPRCEQCGRWNTLGLYLPAASTPEPSIQPAPTWSSP